MEQYKKDMAQELIIRFMYPKYPIKMTCFNCCSSKTLKYFEVETNFQVIIFCGSKKNQEDCEGIVLPGVFQLLYQEWFNWWSCLFISAKYQ